MDTDHIFLGQREHPQVKQQISGIELANFAVTMITVKEQLREWLDSIRRAASEPPIALTYDNLKQTYLFFLNLNLLGFDNRADFQFTELRQQGIRIGTQNFS